MKHAALVFSGFAVSTLAFVCLVQLSGCGASVARQGAEGSPAPAAELPTTGASTQAAEQHAPGNSAPARPLKDAGSEPADDGVPFPSESLEAFIGQMAPGKHLVVDLPIGVIRIGAGLKDGETVSIGTHVYEFEVAGNGVTNGRLSVSVASPTAPDARKALMDAINRNTDETALRACDLGNDRILVLYKLTAGQAGETAAEMAEMKLAETMADPKNIVTDVPDNFRTLFKTVAEMTEYQSTLEPDVVGTKRKELEGKKNTLSQLGKEVEDTATAIAQDLTVWDRLLTALDQPAMEAKRYTDSNSPARDSTRSLQKRLKEMEQGIKKRPTFESDEKVLAKYCPVPDGGQKKPDKQGNSTAIKSEADKPANAPAAAAPAGQAGDDQQPATKSPANTSATNETKAGREGKEPGEEEFPRVKEFVPQKDGKDGTPADPVSNSVRIQTLHLRLELLKKIKEAKITGKDPPPESSLEGREKELKERVEQGNKQDGKRRKDSLEEFEKLWNQLSKDQPTPEKE